MADLSVARSLRSSLAEYEALEHPSELQVAGKNTILVRLGVLLVELLDGEGEERVDGLTKAADEAVVALCDMAEDQDGNPFDPISERLYEIAHGLEIALKGQRYHHSFHPGAFGLVVILSVTTLREVLAVLVLEPQQRPRNEVIGVHSIASSVVGMHRAMGMNDQILVAVVVRGG